MTGVLSSICRQRNLSICFQLVIFIDEQGLSRLKFGAFTFSYVWRAANTVRRLQRVHDVVHDFKDALLATFYLLQLLKGFLVVTGRVRLLYGPLVLDLFTV